MSRTYRKKNTYGSKSDYEVRKTKGNPYKSTLEQAVARGCLQNYLYEPTSAKVNYTVPHVYNPDFVHPLQPDILIEVKGYFIKGSSDCQKYLSIIRDNPDKELVFLFSDASKKAYAGCRLRKDGSYLSLGEWCFKNRILYYTPDTFPEQLMNGEVSLEELRAWKEAAYEALQQ